MENSKHQTFHRFPICSWTVVAILQSTHPCRSWKCDVKQTLESFISLFALQIFFKQFFFLGNTSRRRFVSSTSEKEERMHFGTDWKVSFWILLNRKTMKMSLHVIQTKHYQAISQSNGRYFLLEQKQIQFKKNTKKCGGETGRTFWRAINQTLGQFKSKRLNTKRRPKSTTNGKSKFKAEQTINISFVNTNSSYWL